MRILLVHRVGGAWGYITDGFLNAFRDRGHTVERWDGNEKSWRNFNPDLYIGCSGHQQPIPAHGKCKVAIHVNPYGPVEIPGINEQEPPIRWTLTQKPDAVFGYGHEDDRIVWSYWTTKHGIPWVPMPSAGDKIIFKEIIPLEDRQYDIVYLGGRWAYKAQTIDRFLLPTLSGTLTYKLHGWGDWPSGICSGILPDDQVNRFLNSGRVGPCISEKHTHLYGIDIPERAFKMALCGTLVIHDAVPTLLRMIPSAVVATTPEMFRDKCEYYCHPDHAAERIELAKKQQAEVLAGHTYHHRLSGLLKTLGFVDEAQGML